MNLNPPKTPGNHNALGYAEFFRAARWSEENQATLKGVTQSKAAELVSTGTGMRITVANIVALSKATGIEIRSRAEPKAKKHTAKSTIDTLATALLALYEGLGHLAPEDLRVLAARQTKPAFQLTSDLATK